LQATHVLSFSPSIGAIANGCPVDFNADRLEWHFHAEVLERACPNANPVILSVDLGDEIDAGAEFRGHSSVRKPHDMSRARLGLEV
jgi:hypothetical protein